MTLACFQTPAPERVASPPFENGHQESRRNHHGHRATVAVSTAAVWSYPIHTGRFPIGRGAKGFQFSSRRIRQRRSQSGYSG